MTRQRRITRLLIANRGEIAVRIMRTAQARGITCIAVFSDPDAHAMHVEHADLAVALGGSTSAQSYLDAEKILAAARASDADAIHPGYGFLSENAQFARAVLEAGLTWIGPPPQAIAAMAEKVPAKRLVAAAGVPLVPGAELSDHISDDELVAAADTVGYPLMVKASSGGGGKGMRVVGEPDNLLESVAAARREAASAFGDATVFLERYLPTARHIEVQVFADDYGNVCHVFERECSIQRRHQKVVEEAPAPFLADDVRNGLHRAAVAAAAAIDYRGAGTVEFLVAGDEYFFLEMNTRLQVEHPVTELITGLDLVGMQLDVASGLPLPPIPDTAIGHAVEARLYAEDPRNDDLPSVGTLQRFDLDTGAVRVDSGFRSGDAVSPHYDPMLAKVIAHGPTRTQAAAMLARALNRAVIHGVTTNRDLLAGILESSQFCDGPVDTSFLTQHVDLRHAGPSEAVLRRHAIAAAAGWWSAAGSHIAEVATHVATPGWRNVQRPTGLGITIRPVGESDTPWVIHQRRDRSGDSHWGIAYEDPAVQVEWTDIAVDVTQVDPTGATVRLTSSDGVCSDQRVTWRTSSDTIELWVDGPLTHSSWTVQSPLAGDTGAVQAGGPSAPVPGTVAAVLVAAGDHVVAGQTLVVIEAMKMEHRICADVDADVVGVAVAVGQSVDAHEVLVTLDARVEAPAAAAEESEDSP